MSAIMTAAVLGTLAVILGAAQVASVIAGRRRVTARAVAPAIMPPLPGSGVTLHVLPCGCIYYYQRLDREPCPGHARLAAERDDINRLDQQIRQMP